MPTNTPPFNEKEFLLGLLKIVSKEYGSEERFIFQHKFNTDDLSILSAMPTLKKHEQTILAKKFISQWMAEALSRGLVERRSHDPAVYLTRLGYEKSVRAKSPFEHFVKSEYKWLIPVSISFILGIIAILRYMQCK